MSRPVSTGPTVRSIHWRLTWPSGASELVHFRADAVSMAEALHGWPGAVSAEPLTAKEATAAAAARRPKPEGVHW